MKYSFGTGVIEYPDGYKRSYPCVDIEDSVKYGWVFNAEITHIGSNLDYVIEIVEKLEAVLNDEIELYKGFGFELYLIQCSKNECKVINLYEDKKVEAVIPTQEIYELMRDWRDYLMEWNKKEANGENVPYNR